MKSLKLMLMVCLIVSAALVAAQAQDRAQSTAPGCENVRGRIYEAIVPAPNDPFGRVAGAVFGRVDGVATAIITSIAPTSTGLHATTEDIIVTPSGDKLFFTGDANFTPIPGTNPTEGHFTDDLTLTVGVQRSVNNATVTFPGTGKFAHATGSLKVTGEGHFLFVNPLTGNGYFQLRYEGQICGLGASK